MKKKEYYGWQIPRYEERIEKVGWLKYQIENPTKYCLLSVHRKRKEKLKHLLTQELDVYERAKKIIEEGHKFVSTKCGVGYLVTWECGTDMYFGTSSCPSPCSAWIKHKSCKFITATEYMTRIMCRMYEIKT